MKALQPFLPQLGKLGFRTSTERRLWEEGKRLPRLGGGTLKTLPYATHTQAKPWLAEPTIPVVKPQDSSLSSRGVRVKGG